MKIKLTKALFVGGLRNGETADLTDQMLCMTHVGEYLAHNYEFLIDDIKYIYSLFVHPSVDKSVIEAKSKELATSIKQDIS